MPAAASELSIKAWRSKKMKTGTVMYKSEAIRPVRKLMTVWVSLNRPKRPIQPAIIPTSRPATRGSGIKYWNKPKNHIVRGIL